MMTKNNGTILYNTIGTGYNSTRQADSYIVSKLSELLGPEPGKVYLDIGCGTGNYTTEIAKDIYTFIGVEPSEKMLEIAKSRSQTTGWLLGSVEKIPAGNDVFDGAIGTLTIHHWTNLKKAFEELFRVLKTGSKLVLFTSTPKQMKGYWLNHYFPKMLARSIDQMPHLETIRSATKKAGFKMIRSEKYFVQNDLKDLFLYAGKNRPELYLNERVRKGISSFAVLSLQEEVETGLQNLESDIRTHKIEQVISQYENGEGDYLFVIIEK